MKQKAALPFILVVLLSPVVYAGYTPSELTTASDDTIETIPLEATVVESPAEIKIKTYASGTFSIYRKAATDSNWGTAVATGVTLASGGFWSDTTVTLGSLYEYKFVNTAGTPASSIYPTGYILSGIKVDQAQPKGRLALVVASDVPVTLPSEYAQYKSDLVTDGWTVHEITCPRAPNYAAAGLGAIATVTVSAGGTSYTNSDIVTLTSGVKKAEGKLTVSGGVITGVTILSGGGGFIVGDALTISNNSSGTGATLTVATLNNTSAASAVVITSGGSGYTDNDTVSITGVTSGKVASGSLVAPAGSVTAISAVLPNTFTPGESLVVVSSAGGSGLVATVAPVDNVHLVIRERIQTLNTNYPGELKSVVLVGKVPVCRSGISYGGPDGHGNRAAYATDAFYADMDGAVGVAGGWVDTGSNRQYESDNSFYTEQYNLPGDKKFDANRISQVGNGVVELGYGRIDLSNGIKMEWEAMRNYFNKLHRYKTASPDFLPGRRICDRLSFPNVRETAIQSMPSVVGWDNIEVIPKNAPPTVNGGDDPDAAYSAAHGPYLFYFKGGSPPLNGEGGKAVFWTGMQSHYGYWYDSNLMVQRTAEDSFCLSWTWDIWGLRYIYHRMGMGLDAADMMRQSINNQGSSTATYAYKFNNTSNGSYHGSFFMANVGDPALRLFMFAPPLKLSVVKNGGNPSLSWMASSEPTVTGYHVYRKPFGNGPFTRLTSSPQAGTTYTDATVSSGKYTYMVRAVRLETSGGGTFYNPSLGIQQTLDLSNAPAAITISNTSLANANWNTAYLEVLTAEGGVPQFSWSLVFGSLPPGLVLSSDGIISGTSTGAGIYTFTVRATDQASAAAQKVFSITCSSNQALYLYPEATAHTSKQTPTNNYGTVETNYITGQSAYMYETFQRYDLSGVNLNNGFVRATLQLYVSSETAANTYSLVQGNLLADTQDGWTEAGRSVQFETAYANNGSGKIRLTCFDHGFETGNQVTIEGFPASPPNGLHIITKIDDDHFDIPANFAGAGLVDPALAYATAANINYNNRPTTYNTNVPTLSASGNPVAGTFLEMDVTSFVAETLANDPAKRMSLRLFTTGQQTVYVGSRRAYGVGKPRLVIETSDAPRITMASPTVSPAYLKVGSGLQITALAAAIPARAGALSVLWSKLSGPGTAAFSNTTSASTTVTFSSPGEYVLRLSANDGVLQSFKDLTVWVLSGAITGATDNLTLRLPFDEAGGTVASDVSGSSNHGTLLGTAAWSPSGRIGGALAVGGTVSKNITAFANNGSGKTRITCVGHGLRDQQYANIAGFVQNTGTTTPNGDKVVTVIDPDTFDVTTAYSAAWTLSSATVKYAQSVVRINHSSTLDDTPKLSVSFWINPASIDGSTRTISRKRLASSISTTSYGFTINSGKVSAFADFGSVAAGSRVLPAGQWAHVAMVFDGTLTADNLKLYINGTPEKYIQAAQTKISLKSTSPLWIGAQSDADILPFSGLIDEYRIYQGKALTFAEVQSLAQAVPPNMGPQIVLTTPTVTGPTGQPLAVGATVTDDGLPGALTLGWSKANGPGSVVFSNPVSNTTNATTSTAGSYGLRLTASDGSITTFADVAASFEASGGIDNWRQLHFGTTENTGNAADGAVLQRDGLANLLKYVLGLNPNTDYSNSPLKPKGQMENVSGQDYLTFTFTRDTAVTDATLSVEVINDLAQTVWTTIDPLNPANQVTVLENTPSAGMQTITVKDIQPVTSSSKRFMRLKVTRP